jgi:hypothetical protein
MSSICKEISTVSGCKTFPVLEQPSRQGIELLRSVIGEINNLHQGPEEPTARKEYMTRVFSLER